MRFVRLCLMALCLGVWTGSAQEGLNLPTELYILLNEGYVERYGLGISGVQQVTPAGEFVLDFRVAPDGNWIAYRTESGLFVANMYDLASARQIERENASIPLMRGRGDTIAWSAAADAIAYTTESGGRVHFIEAGTSVELGTSGLFNLRWSPAGRYLAAEAEAGVWWIFRREAGNMVLASAIPGSLGATWLNDTQLVFAPLDGGLFGMDLANANQQIPLLDTATMYRHPQTLRDGRVHVFAGEATAARLFEIRLTPDGAQATDISSGAVDLTDVQWAPGGNLLIAFQGGALALIDPISGGGFTLPISSAVAYSWGPLYPPPAPGLDLPAEGYFLALDNSGIQQVWRLPADGTLPATITPATAPITEYALSPDERRIAYVSGGRLWLYPLGTDSAPIELLVLAAPTMAIQPAFSPDGSTLYFRDEAGIQRIPATGGEVSAFVTSAASPYSHPSPADGLDAVAVIERTDDRHHLRIFAGETGAELVSVAVQPTDSSPATPFWLGGGTLAFVGTLRETRVNDVPLDGGVVTDTPGLFVVDVSNPSQPTLLLPLLDGLRLLDVMALDRAMLRVLVQRRAPAEVQILDVPLAGGTPTIVGSAGYMIDPQLAPDGSAVIGLSAPQGALIAADLTTGRRTLLQAQPQVRQFRWAQL